MKHGEVFVVKVYFGVTNMGRINDLFQECLKTYDYYKYVICTFSLNVKIS